MELPERAVLPFEWPQESDQYGAFSAISPHQRLIIRAIVLVAILMVLAVFGILGRNPPIVH